MKIYFDQNCWHKILKSYDPSNLREIVKSKEIEIYFGLESGYEFGRLLIGDVKNRDSIKDIFSYFCEISDIVKYLKDGNDLILDDITYAQRGIEPFLFLDKFNRIGVKKTFNKISKGRYGEAKKFISRREKNIKKESPEFCEVLKSQNPKLTKKVKFENFRDDWGNKRILLNNSRYGKDTIQLTDKQIFKEPEKYPFLNTWVNAQLYISYAILSQEAKPKNYTSDFRHLICANAAGNFVTLDERLNNVGQKVCPYINILTWDEFETLL